MLQLNEKEVKHLLRLIKNPQDKKTVKEFLGEILEIQSGTSGITRLNSKKRRTAKNALNILWKIGIELGKHALFSEFLNQFD